MAGINAKIARTAGASRIIGETLPEHYSVVPYQSTHNTGGASSFPQNAGYHTRSARSRITRPRRW
jgi:hypothetical protein